MNPSDAQGEPVARPQFHDALTDLVCALVELADAATAWITAGFVEDEVEAPS